MHVGPPWDIGADSPRRAKGRQPQFRWRNGLRGRRELAIFRAHPLSAELGEWASARSLRVAVGERPTSFSEVAQLMDPTLRDMGFELVQVRMVGGSRRTLQVMAEPLD